MSSRHVPTRKDVPVRKIEKYVWEVPQTYKACMKVRGVVYADEELMNKIKTDLTLEQLSNIGCLQGIYKHAIALPDAHQGYGFPIGGVAAIDYDEGVISPGGVGYDINCLAEGTKILSEFGYWRNVEDFEELIEKDTIRNISNYHVSFKITEQRLACLFNKKIAPRPIVAFMKRKADNRILRIKTRTGLEIRCSEDHPIFTGKEFKKAGLLGKKDNISVLYFEGCKREEDYSYIEDSFDEEKVAILTKAFGYILGDGTLTYSRGKYRVCAYGEKHDLEVLQRDIKRLGYHSKIVERSKTSRIETPYGEWEFESNLAELHIYSQEFAKILIRAGMPIGKKTNQDVLVPGWIMRSPKWIKRLFLAGFFGAELTSPKTHTKTGFDAPILPQNKNIEYKQTGREFLIQIMQLLEEFGVRVTKIAERKEARNKEGEVVRLRLEVSAKEENLLRLWRRVGFEYNRKRSQLAEIAVQYILLKKKLTSKRNMINKRVKELKEKGLKLEEVQKLLCEKDANKRFIERCYYENAGQRITQAFYSFDNFRKRAIEEFKSFGTLLDEIEDISVINYDGFVYDFTIAEAHNFVANNVIVSNCGVRLLRSELSKEDILPHINEIVSQLFKQVPTGVGSEGKIRISESALNQVLINGAEWGVKNGYGWDEDIKHCEAEGHLEEANPDKVSPRAKKRGLPQLGSLGSGNHFLEVQYVDKIYNPAIANALNITHEGQITVMIHTGSRGFGHQVCSDYLRVMEQAIRKYKISIPDRELACAPSNSKEADDYYAAMSCAANFAWCNRQAITHWVREAFEGVLKRDSEELGLHLIYDVAHNIAKIEEHKVNGKRAKCYVHRKGATRAFPPGHPEIPSDYKEIGQPVLLPGSMGTASYLLIGKAKGMDVSFGSTAHGAGRVMSRMAAKKRFWGSEVMSALEKDGIVVQAASKRVISEEAPGVYKDIDRVAKISHNVGIATMVARLRPLGVTKG
ncbi:MAG: RtcB family protein [Promethearchaeota archaeon]